jgi:response regulator NasT
VSGALRVVVVDDDVAFRAELRTLLEDAGYDVVGEAADGAQGVELARDGRPDVVLSDLRMPGRSGLQLAADLAGTVPVVLFSAFDDDDLQAQAHRVGARFLVKGCRSRSIFAAIQAAADDRDGHSDGLTGGLTGGGSEGTP